MAYDDLLTTTEAARFLNVRPNTLAIWRSTGRYNLPFVRVGRLVRYRLDDLLEFAERRSATKTTGRCG